MVGFGANSASLQFAVLDWRNTITGTPFSGSSVRKTSLALHTGGASSGDSNLSWIVWDCRITAFLTAALATVRLSFCLSTGSFSQTGNCTSRTTLEFVKEIPDGGSAGCPSIIGDTSRCPGASNKIDDWLAPPWFQFRRMDPNLSRALPATRP